MPRLRLLLVTLSLVGLVSTPRAAIDLDAARAAMGRGDHRAAVVIVTDSLADRPFDVDARRLRAEALFHWLNRSSATYDLEFLKRRRIEDPRLMSMHAMLLATTTTNDFVRRAASADRELLVRARELAPNEPWVKAASWLVGLAAQPKDGGRKGMSAWLSSDSLLLQDVVRVLDGVRYQTTFDGAPYRRLLRTQGDGPAASRSNFDGIAEAWPSLAEIDRARNTADFAGTVVACDRYMASHAESDWHWNTVIFWKGEAQLLAVQYAAALATFQQALAHDPLFPEVHRELATVYEELGQPERARHAAEVALEQTLMMHDSRLEPGDWKFWKAVAHQRRLGGDLLRALDAVQNAEKGARFYSKTPPGQLGNIETERGLILAALAAKPYVKRDAGALGLLQARGWLGPRGWADMPDAPGGFVTRWSSDSTVDVFDADGRGVRLDQSGIGFQPLGATPPPAKKGSVPPPEAWRTPRLLPDGTFVYDFGTADNRLAMRASPSGEFYIGPYDLVTWSGAYVGGDGLRVDPPYRFGLPPAVTERVTAVHASDWKDGGGYYDDCTQFKEYLPDSSVRYSAVMRHAGELDRNAYFGAISIPGEGLYVGSLIDGGSKVPWTGVLYTNDARILGYMRATRVMDVPLGKASKGGFNVPKVDYDATFYWNVTPEGAVTWERNVSGMQRYRFWPSGLWGAYDERDTPSAYAPSPSLSAVAEEDTPDDRGGVASAFDFKRALEGGATCGRCNGRGRVWNGSYMGRSEVCEREIGGGLRCYTVIRENVTGMRTCTWCGGTGRR